MAHASLPPMLGRQPSRYQRLFSRSVIRKAASIICPSFLYPLWQHEHTDDASPTSARQPVRPRASASQHRTAYLDGLRGLAALIVYIYHFLIPFDRSIIHGYMPGAADRATSSSLLGLPVLGLLRSGAAVVHCFFVISGYVLTLSASRARHRGDWDGLLRSLSSATLKRGVRLFVPAVTASFAVLLLFSMGLYTDANAIARYPVHWSPLRPVRKTSFAAQVLDWLGFVFGRLTNPWRWEEELFGDLHASYYGAHLWTIQAEFRCSLVLFLVVMALSRVPGFRTRASLLAGMVVYSAAWARWDVTLFLCGMAFADSDVQQEMDETQEDILDRPAVADRPRWHAGVTRYSPHLMTMGHLVALVAGLWLTSYPETRAAEAVGFGLLSTIHRGEQLWHAAGSALIVWSVRRVRFTHALLMTGPVQYLGKISFALYMVHEPLLQVFGWAFAARSRVHFIRVGTGLGLHEQTGASMGMWLAFFFSSIVITVIADYTWRGLDRPSVALVRKIGRWM